MKSWSSQKSKLRATGVHTKEKNINNIYSITKLVASTNTVLPLDEILYYVTIMTIIVDNQII